MSNAINWKSNAAIDDIGNKVPNKGRIPKYHVSVLVLLSKDTKWIKWAPPPSQQPTAIGNITFTCDLLN